MSWHRFDTGDSIGGTGSEKGSIIRDDEHDGGARITLERDGVAAPFAITCGIYGWMVATESEAQDEFGSMRDELERIVTAIPLVADPDVDLGMRIVSESISEFVVRFP